MRVPELDGLRGLSILMVMMVHIIPFNPIHIDNPIFKIIFMVSSMGWVGVDVFFVLSGFLITSILLRTKQDEGYFKKFYARRILRIFPLYYATITFVFIAVALITPDKRQEILSNMPLYYFYLSNWGFAFNKLSDPFGIGLTWSLAIEEQFYLAWPIIVYYLDSKKLAFFSCVLVVSSLFLRIGLLNNLGSTIIYSEFFYHATFTRLDSLILGALLAIAFESNSWKTTLKYASIPVFFISFGLVGYLAFLQPHSPLWGNPPMYTYGFTFIGLGASGMVIMLTTFASDNPIRRIFRNNFLLFFGKYSYAIYIFHRLPIPFLEDIFKKYMGNNVLSWFLFNFCAIFIPVTLALVSWNLFEKPILNLKKYFTYRIDSVVTNN